MAEIELTFELNALNPDKLHEELMAAAGHRGFFGISTAQKKLRVHFETDASKEDLAKLVEPVILAHDPKQKTDAQTKADANAVLLAALKKPWAEWTEADKDGVLRVLAESLLGASLS